MIRPFLNPDRHRLGGDEIPGMIDKGAVHGAAVQVHGLPLQGEIPLDPLAGGIVPVVDVHIGRLRRIRAFNRMDTVIIGSDIHHLAHDAGQKADQQNDQNLPGFFSSFTDHAFILSVSPA